MIIAHEWLAQYPHNSINCHSYYNNYINIVTTSSSTYPSTVVNTPMVHTVSNNTYVTNSPSATQITGSQIQVGITPPQMSSRPPAPTQSPYDIHQRLFNYKRKSSRNKVASSKKVQKDVPWTHTFVCLPEKDALNVPSDYSVMTANGLGKAKLHLTESSNAIDIHNAIVAQFPLIRECGGYELLRTFENTKRLSVLTSPPEGYTGQFLKKVLGQAKCYIRPLQHDIQLEDCPASSSGVEVNDPAHFSKLFYYVYTYSI